LISFDGAPGPKDPFLTAPQFPSHGSVATVPTKLRHQSTLIQFEPGRWKRRPGPPVPKSWYAAKLYAARNRGVTATAADCCSPPAGAGQPGNHDYALGLNWKTKGSMDKRAGIAMGRTADLAGIATTNHAEELTQSLVFLPKRAPKT